MPRYHFHIRNSRPFDDAQGADLPNDAAAWREATLLCRDIEGSLEPGERWLLEVAEGNVPVFALSITSRRFR
ncbi:MAG: tRNA 5-methylaminomethyl-2-thiouridine synthase [Bradyrhizobium sp.]|uniref:DUF6894 family protein n=1 Tax=Bradyrhizobium sp. TaxID=376 RepID=UPI001DC4AF23|nr:tRNA 5-methylaminomethyl-2-thiouridine synthase [Bradyrhizobium sp.]MBV9558996.1 tRNA 5-methylaminomethyl-2-thiouridine synthase [Bradyrhizobium sp.]